MTNRHLIAGAAALAVLGLGFLAWNALAPPASDAPVFVPVPDEPVPEPVVEEAPSPLLEESDCVPVDAPELPLLDDSDDFVRGQMDDCLAALVADDGLADVLRRAVAMVETAARGELPRGRLALKAPAGKFSVVTLGDRHYIDDATFRRYDAVVDALTCVPPERLASLVRLLRPLLAQALRDLGLPEADIGTVVDAALKAVLAVPVPSLPIEVVETDKGYAYAHVKLETADPLSKQLVRLGPDNLLRLQHHVGELRSLLRGPDPACVVDDPEGENG